MKNITKIYSGQNGEVRALDGISLEIERGSLTAIVGQSGSGKSTLMNILGCLDRPSSGCYRLSGRDVQTLTPPELTRLRRDLIGFVFQKFQLIPTLTAIENIELPLLYANVSQKIRREKALKLLSAVGIADRASHLPCEMSGGQQQRTALCRALITDPPLILADEPTGNLDSASGAEVLSLLQNMHSSGKTVLLITHDGKVAAAAQRKIEIKDGKIIK